MAELGRRAALGAAALALAAEAARAGQPEELRGKLSGDKVELPDLFTNSEINSLTENADPLTRKLGIAIVGLGHLSIDEILPATLSSKHVRVTALVSGEKAKAQGASHRRPIRRPRTEPLRLHQLRPDQEQPRRRHRLRRPAQQHA